VPTDPLASPLGQAQYVLSRAGRVDLAEAVEQAAKLAGECLTLKADVLPLLRHELSEVKDVLRAVEWGGDPEEPCPACPSCGYAKEYGHAEGCRLKRALEGGWTL
jgi:hypothetical protein